MPTIDYNYGWMIYNCFLAFVAVFLGFIFLEIKERYSKILIGILWILFLPNTLYIFTDLVHLIQQWNSVRVSLRSLLFLQYMVLEFVGVITFLVGFLPFEKIASSLKLFKKNRKLILIFCNFCIAFGMVLGRVERINSWDVFIIPQKVIHSALHVLTSFDLLGLTILFGFLCNFVYFLFRDMLLQKTKKYFHVSH